MLLPNVIISICYVSVGCDIRELLLLSKLLQRYLHWFIPLLPLDFKSYMHEIQGVRGINCDTDVSLVLLWLKRNTFLAPKSKMNHLSSVWSFLIILYVWGWVVVWSNFISIWSRNSFSPAETMKRATSWSAVKSTLNQFLFPSAGVCSLYIYICIYEIKISNAVQWMRCLSWSTWAHEDTITSTGQAKHAILCQL